jgi:hypothetical protein
MATKRLNKSSKKVVQKWQYLGETDPAVFIHSNKTHRTASEAFRDADYATAFWREKSEWEQSLEFLASAVIGFMWVAIVVGGLFCFGYWLFN